MSSLPKNALIGRHKILKRKCSTSHRRPNSTTRYEDVFIGEKMAGQGGHINLLNIKNRYYTKVVNTFRKEVDEHLERQDFDDLFREELFEKLHHFFEKYFSASGSIYFTHTAAHDRVYEQVYHANQDVALFWKTQMLYYVKSDILFKEAIISIPDTDGKDHTFHFLVDSITGKKNNEKRELLFTYSHSKDNVHYLNTTYSERGKKTNSKDIARSIRIDEELVVRAVRQFRRQSEVDFFISKNATEFLHKQLDIYVYQYIYDDKTEFTQSRIYQVNTIRQFAQRLIDFIGQFEDELVRIWNKPKFARRSHYVISRNRISTALWKKIEGHEGISKQKEEWKQRELNEQAYLPIDTKYFKDLEPELLSTFESLDKSLDGCLVHSDNYQALNTLKEKYRGQVQCIYIDPPFNLGQNASYDYNVNYKDATWATLLENRLMIAKDFLCETGSIFVRCDYHGQHIVRMLLDGIFGKENFRNEIVVAKSARITEDLGKYHNAHDTLYLYSKERFPFFNCVTTKRKNPKWQAMHLPGVRWSPVSKEIALQLSKENVKVDEKGNYKTVARLIFGKEHIPPGGRHWALSQDSIFERERKGIIRVSEEGQPETLQSSEKRTTDNWTDIPGFSSTTRFPTENAEKLLSRAIRTASREGDLVMDFFMGSATTQAVAHKLKRKWLGIEMGQQIHDVCVPRMKEVLAGKTKGVSKLLGKDLHKGGFFKYYALEQYEETLSLAKYITPPPPPHTHRIQTQTPYCYTNGERPTSSMSSLQTPNWRTSWTQARG